MRILYIMTGCFGILGILWGSLQRRKVLLLESELSSISEQISTILDMKTNGFVLRNSGNMHVNQIIKNINSLLSGYYNDKIQHEKQHKMMRQVMTNISHDLRTPMTVLLGYIEILLEKSKKAEVPEEIKYIIEKTYFKMDNSVRIINQFFNMAQLESGDMRLDISEMDINAVCRDIMLEYYDLLTQKKFQVDIRLSEKPLMLKIDKKATIRIIKNLIDNAIKYGGDGKYLGIYVEEHNNIVKVCCEDHGRGIEEKEIDHIFNRTYTLKYQNRDNYESSGLGLAISQNLAYQMGGKLEVISTPGEKTVFMWILKK